MSKKLITMVIKLIKIKFIIIQRVSHIYFSILRKYRV